MPRPETRTVDQTDDFFGTTVADPYRWLEDGADPEVRAWLAAQAADTRAHLDALPYRDEIAAALSAVVRVPHSGLPKRRGEDWFRTTNDGTQPQDVLVVSDEPFGEARVLIDPNTLGVESTSLADWQPSPDGTLVAYSYSEAGSDWRTWRVRDVASGQDLIDEVRWSKFGTPAWLGGPGAFVYAGFDEPAGDAYVTRNDGGRLVLHRVASDQSTDEVQFALPDEPDVTLWPHTTEDDRWLLILGSRGTSPHSRVWIRDLSAEADAVHDLIATADATWWPVGSAGDELFMVTDRDAPRQRLVAVHAVDGTVREVIAERADQLDTAAVSGGRLLVSWLRDATSRLTLHELDGTEVREIELPGLGSVTGIEARADDAVAHLGWSSFTEPPSVLRVVDGVVDTVFAAGQPPTGLVTGQVRVRSADGTEVPVFLVHRADVTAETGPHPAWLYGYGGFRIPMTPDFEPTRYAFAAAGGVVAVACLRGGGEYGADWHDAGRLANKQNVFDDAAAVAAWLADSGWTDADHLALTGRSNGGLLAGAVLTQRPELFAAVVPEVGVLDMLRFPLWTIGWAWISDYGDPRADAEQFATLHAYSPLHNLRSDAGYPPVMVMTSDHDDRVVPAHSMKFAAQLQAVSPPDAVALLRVDAASGHKAGRSHDALVAERTDVLAFLSQHTELRWSPANGIASQA